MKRLLIIADMEGIAGIGLNEFWATVKGYPSYFLKRHFLVNQVNAAIRGALKAGLKPAEIVVADWHSTHHNFYENQLPQGIILIRDQENKELENGIEQVFLVGFHAAAGTGVRYAHTFRYAIKTFMIGGKPIGETTMWAYNAGSLGIPITLLVGDCFAVREVASLKLETICVETKNEKSTPSSLSICQDIEFAAQQAVAKKVTPLFSASPFSVTFSFKSSKLMRDIPSEYITRRDGKFLVIESKTAHQLYDVFRSQIYQYLDNKILRYKLARIFKKWL